MIEKQIRVQKVVNKGKIHPLAKRRSGPAVPVPWRLRSRPSRWTFFTPRLAQTWKINISTPKIDIVAVNMPRFGMLVIGFPGAGKTTFCEGMHQYLTALGRKNAVINLDPANDSTVPYEVSPLCSSRAARTNIHFNRRAFHRTTSGGNQFVGTLFAPRCHG